MVPPEVLLSYEKEPRGEMLGDCSGELPGGKDAGKPPSSWKEPRWLLALCRCEAVLRLAMAVADPCGVVAGKGGYVPKTDLVAREVTELLAERVYNADRFFFSLSL